MLFGTDYPMWSAKTELEYFFSLGLDEWEKVKSYLLKEFYVLTPWHTEKDRNAFTAYSFFDPQSETGVLLAFRQESCVPSTLPISLPFAEGEAYVLTDTDTGEERTANGAFEIFFEKPREAKLFYIRRK